MCGRYLFYEYKELSERLTQVSIDAEYLDRFSPTWNAAPAQTLPVIVEVDGQLVVQGMHWGLIPKWTKPGQRPKVTPINARAETLGEKPMFRSLVKGRRCVVPSNGFYEWKREGTHKQPYLIEPAEGDLMLFAGLYDVAPGIGEEPTSSFTIVTTASNDAMAELHDRMPVVLDGDEAETWLDPGLTEFEPLEHLLQPASDDAISIRPVSRDVNNPRHDGPALIEPVDRAEID